jgi:trigger factor
MKITSEKLAKAEVKLTVELTELEMENYYQKALEKLASQINVKGFRPGKVPHEVAEQQLEKGYIMAHAIDLAIPPTYIESVKQEKIEPIAQPKVTVVKDTPLKYEALIPVYPEVKVKDYKKIKLEKQKVEVTDAQVEEEVQHFRGYHATYTEVTDRPAKTGDRVEIDFNGFDETGVPLEGTTSKNHPMVLGEKTFVPGFEENLEGMKVGEEKEFTVTFPKDYFHKPFQSKPVKFKVKLNRLEERHLPELNAEFIKKVAGKDLSEAEFRAEVKSNLLKSREQEEQSRLESQLLEKIRDNTEVDLADSLVDEEIHFIIDEIKENAANRGINWEDFLKATGKTEQQLHEEKKTDAEKRLQLRFGVQELFKLEKIDASDEDLEKAFSDEMKILASMNYEPKIEEQEMLKIRLKNKIKLEKLIAVFLKQ